MNSEMLYSVKNYMMIRVAPWTLNQSFCIRGSVDLCVTAPVSCPHPIFMDFNRVKRRASFIARPFPGLINYLLYTSAWQSLLLFLLAIFCMMPNRA